MIDIEHGRYWDLPWSLVSGCTPCSPGCDHCWSAGLSHHYRRSKRMGQDAPGVPVYTNDKGCFTGKIQTHPDRLSVPLKRRKPTVYSLWNDWCHPDVTHHFRALAVKVASGCPRHTILALTKRPEIAADFWLRHEMGDKPPDNWWSGLTICNQKEAFEKQSDFRKLPGRKFLSLEPLLSDIPFLMLADIDCVICGGETGPGARPLHPDWVRSVRDQCQSVGVPFFFKGWGEYGPSPDAGLPDNLPSSAGYYFPAPYTPGKVWHFGRKAAGRLLDGRTHDDLAWRKG